MQWSQSVKTVRFKKAGRRFNFEKVCKRTYLDIATVNTAISIEEREGFIVEAHAAAGGVSPIPLYLSKTSRFLQGKEPVAGTVSEACEILESEISPISDVRGSAEYKRLLLRQLFIAHFVELFELEPTISGTKSAGSNV